MFSLNGKRASDSTATGQQQQQDGGKKGAGSGSGVDVGDADERRRFLVGNGDKEDFKIAEKKKKKKGNSEKRKAKLAKAETIEEEEEEEAEYSDRKEKSKETCSRMVFNFFKRKRVAIPLVILLLVAAIYCLPFVDVDPKTVARLPQIPFNFHDGPLKPSHASQFKAERLFMGQISGAESVALDSEGNMYMVISGGFVLYAHLNSSSQPKRSYYTTDSDNNNLERLSWQYQDLVKIAELNGVKQLPYGHEQKRRNAKSTTNSQSSSTGGSWRRECQLDEELYGPQLTTGGSYFNSQQQTGGPNDIDIYTISSDETRPKKFATRVPVSRCSVPLGVRLSPDENYLYVVDTLTGLYRVSLRVAERPESTQRLVTRLIDFRPGKRHYTIPVVHLERDQAQESSSTQVAAANLPTPTTYMNITVMAVDDLVIDYGAGARGGDLIYLTLASQRWLAHQYLFDLLEGQPSGLVLRLDTGSQQLTALSPQRVAHVRMTGMEDLEALAGHSQPPRPNLVNGTTEFYGIGAPRLDENDVFDERPLHFPNGLELTDDRQAILICDTSNKRIIKHYIRGARRGTSDLWAWTPNFPDNIRRGYDRQHETYWVIGCGQDMSNKIDALALLRDWPVVRKYFLKNVYLFGWLLEFIGQHIIRSTALRDFGHSYKSGHLLLERYMCPSMMILQYNSYGDIIRSIHSKEFPNDLAYYSQVNEIVDAKNQEHLLYLSSPMYSYVTKLTLPSIKSQEAPTEVGVD